MRLDFAVASDAANISCDVLYVFQRLCQGLYALPQGTNIVLGQHLKSATAQCVSVSPIF